MSKKSLFLVVLIVILGLAYSQRDVLISRLMDRAMESRFGGNFIADLDDGLHLALCGAGGPLPAPNASGPCVVVIAGERMFVVDAGTDGLRNIGRMGMQAGEIEAVFITHYHSDHIDGLGELATIRWVANANTEPLPVYGPEGITRVVNGFNAVYFADKDYRHEHHGDTVAPTSGWGMKPMRFEAPALGELELLIDSEGLKVEALTVGHAPVVPAVGYRFTYKGRTLLITGDTIAMDNIRQFSEGIDLLVHEALAPNLVKQMNRAAKKIGNPVMEKVTIDILDYHASPMEAAQTAKDANVGHLLYYHIVPPIVIPGQESLFLNGADEVFPNYTVGKDGVMFSLPANSDEINLVKDGL